MFADYHIQELALKNVAVSRFYPYCGLLRLRDPYIMIDKFISDPST